MDAQGHAGWTAVVPSSTGSVCAKPAALFLHLPGHHQQHLTQALSQGSCQEGPGWTDKETEAQGALAWPLGEGA